MEDLKNKEPPAVADQKIGLFHLLRSYISNNWTLVKFILVGASGTIVNLGALFLLTTLFGNGFGLVIVFNAIAVETSILNNFVWNDKFTFNSNKTTLMYASKTMRLAKYNLLSLGSFSVNEIVFTALYVLIWNSVPSYKYYPSIIAIGVAFMVNYIGSSRWAWKEKGVPKNSLARESK